MGKARYFHFDSLLNRVGTVVSALDLTKATLPSKVTFFIHNHDNLEEKVSAMMLPAEAIELAMNLLIAAEEAKSFDEQHCLQGSLQAVADLASDELDAEAKAAADAAL
jgi:regulator of protease activity HflC (stomatin/prohibitin superfamily)